MKLTKKSMVLLFSPEQDAFHAETYYEMVTRNIGIFLGEESMGYITMGVFETLDELRWHMKELQKFKDERKPDIDAVYCLGVGE